MIARLLALLVALFAVQAGASAAAPQRIVAVGDLHGDHSAWLKIARAAGLIDPAGRWAGGASVLVQTGDITDRGPDSLKIIRHLQSLQKEARARGGQVIVILGNHEAMQVSGDYRYVHPGEYAAFADSRSKARREAAFKANLPRIAAYYRQKSGISGEAAVRSAWLAETPLGKVEHDSAWAPGGELGQWAASLPAVAKVGDSLFAHGGLSGAYALVPLVEINRRAREAVRAGSEDEAAIINDQLGPLWYRGLAMGTGSGGRTASNELDVALKANGAKRLVIGHTPALGGPKIEFGGRLVRIDTGISAHYGGALGWVEIIGDTVVPRTVAR